MGEEAETKDAVIEILGPPPELSQLDLDPMEIDDDHLEELYIFNWRTSHRSKRAVLIQKFNR